MKKVLSIILCVLIFCIYFILEINLNFSKAFSDNNIKTISNNIVILNEENISKEELYWNTKLNTIYDRAAKYNISKEEVNRILESDEIKEFIFNYANELKNTLLYDNDENFTDEKINIYLKDSINKYLDNNNINNVTKNNINDFISNNLHEIINDVVSPTKITDEINTTNINPLKSFFSLKAKLIILSALLFLLFAVFILNIKNKKWMLYIGITVLLSSIITLLFTYIINPLLIMISNADLSIIISAINNFSDIIIKSYYITNICTIVISIIILITYFTLYNKNNKIS